MISRIKEPAFIYSFVLIAFGKGKVYQHALMLDHTDGIEFQLLINCNYDHAARMTGKVMGLAPNLPDE